MKNDTVSTHPVRSGRTAFLPALVLALTACAVGPTYQGPPPVETPVAFRQGQGEWIRVVPADTLERGPWWQLFGDPVLNDLAASVEVSNQNVAAAVAAYAQARALVAEQRASLFPSVVLDGGGSRTGGEGSATGTRRSYDVTLGAGWEPDVWGRLRRGVAGARAGEQASAADLAAARLSAQGELAVNYLNLRGTDAQRALLVQTLQGYQRALTITNNRYQAGIAARTDVLQAETQLANAQAELLGLDRQRAQLENAIAVLVGRAPGNFSLPPALASAAVPQVPDVPLALPSTLLLRRPDVVSAERRVAAANENIGIAQSAWFPSLQLSGSAGAGAAAIGDLFSAGSLVWALGVSLAQSVFDGGAINARIARSRAAFDQAAAQYRQTVLVAFQDVEDQLAAARILGEQLALRQQAARAADLVEQQVLNRYQAGQVGFTEVITAQATAQAARRNLVQLQADRQVAAVALIQALGGGWQGLPR
ncbi:efflux transporter outer membrane subunit [Ramlibacter tataouinensis]|uniref:Outer membrane protein-like protein n=1 Tax=Ramlibacter tataouinensis (strain ATCC BAA-407 / DSM 14655 / LMG 21543 / TTB310) TaxID=365046 RepID=F5Y659_RAMTT|nr:efflux transporter outer membrane subunit [Ramlibacter tataouinensis]AEG92745.1 outer membrane protein-like protein [Ramlibacter tataouinensis TTB310]